jgi:hypothetical protein
MRVFLIVLAVMAAHPLLWFVRDLPALQASAAFVVMIAAPGLLLVDLIVQHHDESLPLDEWLIYGAGIGFGIGASVVFILGLLPGVLTQVTLLVVFDAMIVGLTILLWRRGSTQGAPVQPHHTGRRSWPFVIGVSLILLLAASMRLTNLGYSQLQGDEATPIVRASAFAQDGEDAVFLQPRGPLDMMIPAGMMALGAAQSELALRLPFALASVVAVGAVISLGALLFGRGVGMIAGLLLALDGFAVAFGRMMHYESVVLLVTTACAMALVKIVLLQRTRSPFDEALARRYVWIAALLAATGILAHYDGLITLIVGGYLFFALWRAGLTVQQLVKIGFAPGAVSLAIVTSFYAAFVLHPNFNTTVERYTESLVDERTLLVNNLLVYAERAGFYFGALHFYFLLVTLWVAVCLAFWKRRANRWSVLLGVLALALPLVLAIAALFDIPFDITFLWIFTIGLGLVLLPGVTVERRLLWLWFGIPFFAALFLTAKPGLHFYLFSPPLALLLGVTIYELYKWDSPLFGKARYLLPVGLLILTFINIVYVYQLFVSKAENAMQAKAMQSAPPLWPAETMTIPILYFGIPYDGGWRIIDALYADGTLQGSYLTNIDRWITDWYTRGAEFCRRQPDYIIVDRFSQPDSAQRLEAEMGDGYTLAATIANDGEPRLSIYGRNGTEPPPVYDIDELNATANRSRATIPITPWSATAPLEPLDLRFGEELALTGVRVDFSPSGIKNLAAPINAGEHLSISLSWELLQETEREYTLFVQLIDENAVKAGQRDTSPACNAGPTSAWRVGRKVPGYYRLSIAPDAPPGIYSLIVGLYDAANQERLYVYDAEGILLGDAVKLRDIQIE